MSTNFFRPGEIIVERLTDALPDILVRRVQDFNEAQREVGGSKPEVLVRFLRLVFDDVAGNQSLIEQQYTAFYTVPGHDEDWERDGPVLAAMLAALTGYEPDDQFITGPFKPVGSVVPQTWEEQGGVLVYPLTFSVPVQA